MIIRSLHKHAFLIWGLLLLMLSSCFTGVEGTKRVDMTRNDVQAVMPTEEDNLVSSITAIPLSEWKPGKEFVVLDDRAALIFDSRTLPSDPLSLHLKGKTLRFVGTDSRVTEGLDTVNRIIFEDTDRQYIYSVRQQEPNSLEIPMLVDMSLVSRFDSLVKGRKMWVTNPYWRSPDSTAFQGLKYAPIEILSVTPGAGANPAQINFMAEDKEAWLPVSLPQAGPPTLRLSRQFSLTDPRKKYPNISNENWDLIQKQQLAVGMTKTEVRLALGDPSDISQGHNSALLYELWQYPDGSYLMFVDGLLNRFKQTSRQPSK